MLGLVLLFSTSTIYIGHVTADPPVTYDPITHTWTITPSGSDDTDDIQYAFDNAAPGDTIYLTAGQFYCKHIEVVDFHGTFKGAGMESTTIDVIPGGPVIYDYFDGFQWNYFFKFTDGDFSISDMQFDITPEHPTDEWWFFEPHTSIGDIIFLTGDAVHACIEQVGFKAHDGDYDGRNVACAVDMWSVDIFGTVSGSLTVSECSFENIDGPIGLERVSDSNAIISHNSMTDGFIGCLLAFATNNQITITHNQFTNMGYTSIYMREVDDVVITHNEIDNPGFSWSPILGWIAKNVEVTHNHITGNYRFGVNPWDGSDGWTIEHNTFGKTKAGETLGISAIFGVIAIEESHHCTAAYNQFFNVHDSYHGAIWVYDGNNNNILNNIIHGTGLMGILIDYSSTGCYLLGNNLIHYDATWADIYLWYGTSYNTVVVGAADSITDHGTNNIIRG